MNPKRLILKLVAASVSMLALPCSAGEVVYPDGTSATPAEKAWQCIRHAPLSATVAAIAVIIGVLYSLHLLRKQRRIFPAEKGVEENSNKTNA